ncbi:MAG: ABC transporter permease subunit [Patescibacteria group bacterium]|nr:ABC transporter permease subunit [Patescibacteria group bacterium]
MKNLFKKEINYYLNNPVGYIVIVLFAIFVNFFFIKDIFVSSIFSLKPLFYLFPWFNMIFIPALTMRSFSEEKRSGTYEVLLTLPVKEKDILLAKFFSILFLFLIGLFLTSGILIFIVIFSKANFLELLIGYFGQLLLASFFISISLYFSILTKNQIVAFLLGVLINFFLLVFSSDFVGSIIPRIVLDNLIIFIPNYHLENFTKGILSFSSLFYFLSFIFFFLYLTFLKIKTKD